jgi:hypothetical protein
MARDMTTLTVSSFCANYVGITVAYWIGYGLRTRRRHQLVSLAFPSGLPGGAHLHLASDRLVLSRVASLVDDAESSHGGNSDPGQDPGGLFPQDDPELRAEIEQLDTMVESSNHPRYRFLNVTFGRYSGKQHLGRRVALAIGIMLMMEWTGILAIAVYTNTIFSQAGYDSDKAGWLSGLCNTIGIFGTAAGIFTIDRFGRRISMFFGFSIQAVALFLSSGLGRLGQLHR